MPCPDPPPPPRWDNSSCYLWEAFCAVCRSFEHVSSFVSVIKVSLWFSIFDNWNFSDFLINPFISTDWWHNTSYDVPGSTLFNDGVHCMICFVLNLLVHADHGSGSIWRELSFLSKQWWKHHFSFFIFEQNRFLETWVNVVFLSFFVCFKRVTVGYWDVVWLKKNLYSPEQSWSSYLIGG